MIESRGQSSAMAAANASVTRITWIGIFINIALSILKGIVGAMVGSISLLADGAHSLSDLLTDAAVLVGVKASARPADSSHPWGHGKYETFATVFVSLILALIGFGIIWTSAKAFFHDRHPLSQTGVILTAMLSIVSKEWLFQATARIARQVHSAAVLANAWHHRSDALSSVAVVAGALISLAGWPHGDQLAGVIVGFMVSAAGGQILFGALMELSEASIDRQAHEALEGILRSEAEIRNWHKARGRRVGRQIFMECHVRVDPRMTVLDSHELTRRIEARLCAALAEPANLLIHIEPYEPDATPAEPATGHFGNSRAIH